MFFQLLFGYKITQCLYVAAKLGIADYLLSGKKSALTLAKLTDTDPDALYRVMRCLVAFDVFREDQNKCFDLNEISQMLLSESDNTYKDFVILCGEELYQSAGDLLFSVQTGKPAFPKLFGMSHWEYLENNKDKADTFNKAMGKGGKRNLMDVIRNHNFSIYKKIIDVGGGMGHLLCSILEKFPHTTGIVYDLPHAKQIAIAHIAERGLSSRCEVLSGNFLSSMPSDGDAYLLKVILHDWDDNNSLLLLKNCHAAMHANSHLIIIDRIIHPDMHKQLTCLADINMLVTLTGRERSLENYKELLQLAGFAIQSVTQTSSTLSIIDATKINFC